MVRWRAKAYGQLLIPAPKLRIVARQMTTSSQFLEMTHEDLARHCRLLIRAFVRRGLPEERYTAAEQGIAGQRSSVERSGRDECEYA